MLPPIPNGIVNLIKHITDRISSKSGIAFRRLRIDDASLTAVFWVAESSEDAAKEVAAKERSVELFFVADVLCT